MPDGIQLVFGAIIAGLVGLFNTEYRLWKERRERRRWLASGLLTDIRRTKAILDGIPRDSAEQAGKAVAEVAFLKPLRMGILYPRNGLYSTHYAEIIDLGQPIAQRIVLLYEALDQLERICEYLRDDQYVAKRILEVNNSELILKAVGSANLLVDAIIPSLEKIANEKPTI